MNIEVVIVGAGAAGIAAARRLSDRGHDILLVEAIGRVGGRAHTISTSGMPLDLGCGWLHSAERNPLVALAESANIQIDRSKAAWGNQYRNLGFSQAEQRAAERAYAELHEILHNNPPASDCAGDAITADHPWRPWMDMLSGALNGAELDKVSARDLLAYDDHASEANWRLPQGYGALFAKAAAGLRTALNTRVTAIDHDDSTIRITTAKGVIRAQAAIVALPTNILARGDILFRPAIDEHLHAAARLPLGQVEKLFLSLAEAEAVPPEGHLLGNPHNAVTGSYYLRPFGRPVIECFFGGLAVEALPTKIDRLRFAIDELGRLLGSEFARGLAPLAGSAWRDEPTIGGAYSHALPGHADERRTLAAPASERLHFAGEACSPFDFTTAHGAWQSGLAAAEAVETMLRQDRAAPTPAAN